MRIAIDGTASSGKGTLAKRVAKRLGYSYIDTGALYRTVALVAFERGISWQDGESLGNLAQTLDIVFSWKDEGLLIFCNGRDVSKAIRSEKASEGASIVSALPQVRAALLSLQKNLAKQSNVVMDGRDIGTVIMPDAELKIYVDASLEVRAQRRHQQFLDAGRESTYQDVLADLEARDQRDMTRAIAPLKKANDAKVLDNTDLSIEESIACILQWVDDNQK